MSQKDRAKRHYQKNRKAYIERKKKRRQKIRAQITAYKEERSCTDCGNYFSHYVMDFDHVKGEKKFAISRGPDKGLSFKTILKEIDKCELVCANCHRVRTFTRKQVSDS